MTYADDVRLPSYGLALTNIVPRATRAASELTRPEFVAGRAQLARVIRRASPGWSPSWASPSIAPSSAPPRAGGPGPKRERIGTARVFVLPNPSGLNASYPGFRDKLIWFKRLRRWV